MRREKKLQGLQRLRWYCQVCERQMRTENAFKQHTSSEAHVRAMSAVAENPKAWIERYSSQFQSSFLNLLKTSHREKAIQINRFYQEYISDKSHVHLNATKWHSLNAFASHLGRSGLCHIEEKEDGILISWMNTSPETIRRRDAVAKADKSRFLEEEAAERDLQDQIERAEARSQPLTVDEQAKHLRSDEGRPSINISLPSGIYLTDTDTQGEIKGTRRRRNVFSAARKVLKTRDRPLQINAHNHGVNGKTEDTKKVMH